MLQHYFSVSYPEYTQGSTHEIRRYVACVPRARR